MTSTILWLRRDLRVHDHPGLAAALEGSDEVVPVFCLDRRLLGGRHRSGPRTQFMLDALGDLDRSFAERGSRLVIIDGSPERELPKLARITGAATVHASADAGPFARRREMRVQRALRSDGLELLLHPGVFVVDDPAAIRTRDGRAQTIFTPYYRAWLEQPRRASIPPPQDMPGLPAHLQSADIPSLQELGLEQSLANPPSGGERAGRELLDGFLAGALSAYAERRDRLDGEGGSSLSPYLHFGCISPREIEERLGDGAGAREFARQLCWRDFYAQVLRSFPRNARSEHQARYRGRLQWSHAKARFAAWCEGRTGYPVIDAAMRQLSREGWMPNRARLITGSFLTKDLWIDWRWGERWFMRHLLDGDEASNNGNWQWIASVGVDPQPPARRLYNPTLQQQRFDPDGLYVRRYLPELARVPQEYLAEPWRMAGSLQAQVGCVIGEDYPAPIVDHGQARREALARFAAAPGVPRGLGR